MSRHQNDVLRELQSIGTPVSCFHNKYGAGEKSFI